MAERQTVGGFIGTRCAGIVRRCARSGFLGLLAILDTVVVRRG